MIEKDGDVALVITSGYGAGWSTWSPQYGSDLATDDDIVNAVLNDDIPSAHAIAKSRYPDAYVSDQQLVAHWARKDARCIPYIVDYHDGNERVEYVEIPEDAILVN